MALLDSEVKAWIENGRLQVHISLKEGWVTTQDGNRLYLDGDGELRIKPDGPSIYGDRDQGGEEASSPKENRPGAGMDDETLERDHSKVKPEEFDTGILKHDTKSYAKTTRVGRAWAGGESPKTPEDAAMYAALTKRYKETQEKLEEQGVEQMIVYRGADVLRDSAIGKALIDGSLKVGDTFETDDISFASHSTDMDIADEFAETPIPTVDADGEFTSNRIEGLSVGMTVERVVDRRDIVAAPSVTKSYAPQAEVIAFHRGSVKLKVVAVYLDDF